MLNQMKSLCQRMFRIGIVQIARLRLKSLRVHLSVPISISTTVVSADGRNLDVGTEVVTVSWSQRRWGIQILLDIIV